VKLKGTHSAGRGNKGDLVEEAHTSCTDTSHNEVCVQRYKELSAARNFLMKISDYCNDARWGPVYSCRQELQDPVV